MLYMLPARYKHLQDGESVPREAPEGPCKMSYLMEARSWQEPASTANYDVPVCASEPDIDEHSAGPGRF